MKLYLQRNGKRLLKIDSYELSIITESGSYGAKRITVKYQDLIQDSIFYAKEMDSIQQGIESLEELIRKVTEEIPEARLRKEEFFSKVSDGFREITVNDMKEILMSTVPEYISSKDTARSGSEYWKINGKEIRFSDHERIATSRHNFTKGLYTNVLTGFCSKKQVVNYILSLVESCDVFKIKNEVELFFNKKEIPAYSESLYYSSIICV